MRRRQPLVKKIGLGLVIVLGTLGGLVATTCTLFVAGLLALNLAPGETRCADPDDPSVLLLRPAPVFLELDPCIHDLRRWEYAGARYSVLYEAAEHQAPRLVLSEEGEGLPALFDRTDPIDWETNICRASACEGDLFARSVFRCGDLHVKAELSWQQPGEQVLQQLNAISELLNTECIRVTQRLREEDQ
jgi:hypothetical protein